MGQGKAAPNGVKARLIYCQNRAQTEAKICAVLRRSEAGDTGPPPRYAIIVREHSQELRKALEALRLGVSLLDRGEWLMAGPNVDKLGMDDAARRSICRFAIDLLNEQLGKFGQFSMACLETAEEGKARIVYCPEKQRSPELACAGR